MKKYLLAVLLFAGFAAISAEEIITVSREDLKIVGSTVTGFDDWKYIEAEALHVEIPEGITKIEKDAFYCASSIVSVKLPSGLKIIGADAFYGCENLSLTIPAGVSKIGEGAFAACQKISGGNDRFRVGDNGELYDNYKKILLYFPPDFDKDFRVPDFVERIGNRAFMDCDTIGIELNDNLKSIGAEAFSGCEFLSLTIPAGVSEIGEGAFFACESINLAKGNDHFTLNNMVLIDKDKGILLYFPSNAGLTSYRIPDTVSVIGEFAFADCVLDNLIIPGTVEKINDSAFQGCFISSVTLEYGVKRIGNYSFADCKNLKAVKFPRSISHIGNFAFFNCEELRDVTFSTLQVKLGNRVFYKTKCEKEVKKNYPSLFPDGK